MTLIQLSYIITIAETGSLNKAAEQLYVSQTSLTNAVKELENLALSEMREKYIEAMRRYLAAT